MIPPLELGDVAIDEDTADIADREDNDHDDADAEETTRLQPGQESVVAGETPQEEEEEAKAEEDTVEGVEGRDEDMALWVGQPPIKGSTETMRMILLTFSLIGLQ